MKLKKLKIGILFFGLALFASNDISAQERGQNQEKRTPPTFKELLKEMDANEDGKLSKNEVKGPIKNDFDKIDTDEDGFITKKELEKAPKPDGKRPQKRNN